MNYSRIGTFCPVCGEFINGGFILYGDGRPENTICLEDFEQMEFCCERCNTSVYTGDYESMCEVEEGEHIEDEDEDDEYD